MAEARGHGDFKLVTEGLAWSYEGGNVPLPCHLSPKTSASSMTIRWFKESECIYLYKNGQVIEGRGFEGRLTLNIQDLQKGNVSLRLRDYRETDNGVYICQVKHGEQEEEIAVGLTVGLGLGFLGELGRALVKAETEAEAYLSKETAEQKNSRLNSAHVFATQLDLAEDMTQDQRQLFLDMTHDQQFLLTCHKYQELKKEMAAEQRKLTQEVEKLTAQLKQRDDQLKKKDEELRMMKKERDDVTTEKNRLGVEQLQITLTTEMKEDFMKKNWTELVKRVTEVQGVLDDLLREDFLSEETNSNIKAEGTSEAKVRMLHDIMKKKGKKAMSAFYDALQKHEKHLVKDLKEGGHH